MASLQDLCLNAIEKTGTSVRELLKDATASEKITHRHPVLRIIACNSFGPSYEGYYIFPRVVDFEILTNIMIEFDGVYTMHWSREIYSLDDSRVDADDITLIESEMFKEVMKAMPRFFETCYPDFPIWNGTTKFDSEDTTLLSEAEKLINGCLNICSSIITPSGEKIMDLQQYYRSSLESPDSCSNRVTELKSAVEGLRKLSICY